MEIVNVEYLKGYPDFLFTKRTVVDKIFFVIRSMIFVVVTNISIEMFYR